MHTVNTPEEIEALKPTMLQVALSLLGVTIIFALIGWKVPPFLYLAAFPALGCGVTFALIIMTNDPEPEFGIRMQSAERGPSTTYARLLWPFYFQNLLDEDKKEGRLWQFRPSSVTLSLCIMVGLVLMVVIALNLVWMLSHVEKLTLISWPEFKLWLTFTAIFLALYAVFGALAFFAFVFHERQYSKSLRDLM